MSDHEEDTSISGTGWSTPVPELDDHTHHSPSIQRTQSPRNTVETLLGRAATSSDNVRDKGTMFNKDCEEAISDDESEGAHGQQHKSRRGTVTTMDPRSESPPNSIKAFAAMRRERGLSTSEPNALHRTTSGSSRRSRKSRRYTNDNDAKSYAGSNKSAKDDVCFPLHESPKEVLDIDFEYLEDFIAGEEEREKANQTPARVFHDLRPQQHEGAAVIVTAGGDLVETSSRSSVDEKNEVTGEKETKEQPHAENRFEFFSSIRETTIHAAEFGDLVLPGEDIRSLFTLPQSDESVAAWWLNVNNPSVEEIQAIGKAFGVHPLTIEDISQQEAREKIELFPSYYFACFRSFYVEETEDGQEYEPFNIYVVVFREGTMSFSFTPNQHTANVRKRIAVLKEYIDLSSDWICYALIDDIVDSFAPYIKKIENETDSIDDEVFIARSDDMHEFLRKIGTNRKNVMALMKLLGGKADVLKGFTKRCNANYKVTPRMDIGLYLGDIQDHVVTMMTNLGAFEKMLSRSHGNYLAQLSIDNITQGNRNNKVLSQITLLASILVPLNLVCGLFGMNVEVPWKNANSLAPFFGILASLIVFTFVSLGLARKLRFI